LQGRSSDCFGGAPNGSGNPLKDLPTVPRRNFVWQMLVKAS